MCVRLLAWRPLCHRSRRVGPFHADGLVGLSRSGHHSALCTGESRLASGCQPRLPADSSPSFLLLLERVCAPPPCALVRTPVSGDQGLLSTAPFPMCLWASVSFPFKPRWFLFGLSNLTWADPKSCSGWSQCDTQISSHVTASGALATPGALCGEGGAVWHLLVEVWTGRGEFTCWQKRLLRAEPAGAFANNLSHFPPVLSAGLGHLPRTALAVSLWSLPLLLGTCCKPGCAQVASQPTVPAGLALSAGRDVMCRQWPGPSGPCSQWFRGPDSALLPSGRCGCWRAGNSSLGLGRMPVGGADLSCSRTRW